MDLAKFSEENFITFLKEQFIPKDSVIGIGDDCAVIPYTKDSSLLVTTDALVEGVHFLKEEIPPEDLGYKTLAVNVSDLAAMGGEPKYAFLSIALPKPIDPLWVQSFIKGFKEACAHWNVQLLGGDTVGSKRDIFINLTLIGVANTETIKYRSSAEIDDIICVTNTLGNSGGGLKIILNNLERSDEAKQLIDAHFRPHVDPRMAMWLAAQKGVHAMMDVSDGLDCDLTRLLESSKKGAIIDVDKLPISNSLSQTCLKEGWDKIQLALTGGEDYCLLFTVSPHDFKEIKASFQKLFGMSLFNIGEIQNFSNEIIYRKNGKVFETNFSNFNHF
jgi:thiamine-monophosphate kinase